MSNASRPHLSSSDQAATKKKGDGKQGAEGAAAKTKADDAKGQDAKKQAPTAPTLNRPRVAAAAKRPPTLVAGTHPTLCFCPTCAPAVVEEGGQEGAGAATKGESMACEAHQAAITPAGKNAFGEFDGEATSDAQPHLFTDGGSVGTGPVHWAGGNGGVGLQNVGSITLVAPTYEGSEPDAAAGTPAKAWINNAASASVFRSWRGVQTGDQGAGGYYFTAAAATRAGTHENAHVVASRAAHNTHISPLETRVAAHSSQATAKVGGATKAEAIAALKAYVDWNGAVTAFQNEDTRQNTPMGAVDTVDLAAADFIEDRGARTVGGTAFTHVVCKKGEPNPAP